MLGSRRREVGTSVRIRRSATYTTTCRNGCGSGRGRDSWCRRKGRWRSGLTRDFIRRDFDLFEDSRESSNRFRHCSFDRVTPSQ